MAPAKRLSPAGEPGFSGSPENGISPLPEEPGDGILPRVVGEVIYPVPELFPGPFKGRFREVEVPPLHDAGDSPAGRIKHENPPAPVIPACRRSRRVDRANGPEARRIEPEKGAGVLPMGRYLSGGKELAPGNGDLDLRFFTRVQVLEEEPEGAPLFPDGKDLSHDAAAFPALLAEERHRRYLDVLLIRTFGSGARQYFFPPPGELYAMKKLERPRKGRLLGGVCAGIGTYFDLDPVLVRILWVALTVASVGIGVIVYIAAWILMPEEEEEKTPAVSATP